MPHAQNCATLLVQIT